MEKTIRKRILRIASKISNKRAKIVIEHILKHGFITTEQLEKDYGYNHPPRAARDVRESGIPLTTYRVKSSDGRSIAAYQFGDPSEINENKLEGRRTFTKNLRKVLFLQSSGRCFLCNIKLDLRYFQIDHRIPYELAGDKSNDEDLNDFMLLCASCNRSKSWSCEHCENWQTIKDSAVCERCFWHNPLSYDHIALTEERRISLVWQGKEIKSYEELHRIAYSRKMFVSDLIKEIISSYTHK